VKYFIPYIEDCVHVVSRIQLISKTRDYTLLCPCVRGARTDLVLLREMISPFVARKATLCCALTAMSIVFLPAVNVRPSLNSRLPKLRQGTLVDVETVKRRQPWSGGRCSCCRHDASSTTCCLWVALLHLSSS